MDDYPDQVPFHALIRRDRAKPQPRLIRRHRFSTRLWHWLNALVMLVMVMSGLMIFNAHPRLYWGAYGANDDAAWLEIGAWVDAAGRNHGGITLMNRTWETTGVLGLSRGSDGAELALAFPGWVTLPSTYDLALGRSWHLAGALVLAWGLLAYLVWSLFSGHGRDWRITRAQGHPAAIWRDLRAHLRLPVVLAEHYGVVQKLAYAVVLFGLLPLMIASGLAMAPGVDAGLPWIVDMFGGRQSARSVHFIGMLGLVLFVLVHLVMVLASGPINQMRGMITGHMRVPPLYPSEEDAP
jgi:thiosulfate reductase cytochrome b subunit